MWLRRSKLKIKEVFNWQIFRGMKKLIEVTYGLNKEGSRKVNKLEGKKESIFNQKRDL